MIGDESFGGCNRTDIFAAPAVSVTVAAAAETTRKSLPVAVDDTLRIFRASPQWQRRVQENIVRQRQWRLPGVRDTTQQNE